MHFLKTHFWKLILVGGAVGVASWFGWGYADQKRPTLIALNTTTGKLQWVYPLASDFNYSKGPIAGNGKVVLDGCLKTADKNCGAYQIQTFDARSGKLLWSIRPSGNYDPSKIASNQATVIQSDRLYSQLENQLRSIDLTTGTPQWTIPRSWGSSAYGIGLVVLPDKLAMVGFDSRDKRFLRIIDPKTGRLQQQAFTTLPKLEGTNRIIAANDRTLFLETAGRVPGDTPDSFYDSGTSTVTAYDSKTLQPRFRTDIKGGGILQMNAIPQSGGFANGNILLLKNDSDYNPKLQESSGITLLAMDTNTGKVLWRKPSCFSEHYRKYQVDADTIYFVCGTFRSSQVVALSNQTGAVKWQTQPSVRLNFDFPATVTDRQYLTFREVSETNTSQTQAVGLDRQTGKLLWTFPLFNNVYLYRYGTIVSAEGDRLFTLDVLPRWQLWLLQMNLDWYVNQPISN